MPDVKSRAIDHPNLGPKIGSIPNAKKYVFSQFQTKNSQFNKFFGGFSICIIQNILLHNYNFTE